MLFAFHRGCLPKVGYRDLGRVRLVPGSAGDFANTSFSQWDGFQQGKTFNPGWDSTPKTGSSPLLSLSWPLSTLGITSLFGRELVVVLWPWSCFFFKKWHKVLWEKGKPRKWHRLFAWSRLKFGEQLKVEKWGCCLEHSTTHLCKRSFGYSRSLQPLFVQCNSSQDISLCCCN